VGSVVLRRRSVRGVPDGIHVVVENADNEDVVCACRFVEDQVVFVGEAAVSFMVAMVPSPVEKMIFLAIFVKRKRGAVLPPVCENEAAHGVNAVSSRETSTLRFRRKTTSFSPSENSLTTLMGKRSSG